MPTPEEEKTNYTYADYLTWDDGLRWEIVDGVRYVMFGDESCVASPAPAWEHQGIGGEIFRQIATFLKGEPAKVFQAPFDVRLNADAGDNTVFQPEDVFEQ